MEVIKGGKSGKPDETKMVSLDLSVLQTIIDISKTIETLRDKYYEVRTKSEEEIELYWIDFAKYWIENAAPFSTYVLDKLGGADSIDYSVLDEYEAKYTVIAYSHIDSIRMEFASIEDAISNMSFPGLLIAFHKLLLATDNLTSDFLAAMKEDPYFCEWWNDHVEKIETFISNGKTRNEEEGDSDEDRDE